MDLENMARSGGKNNSLKQPKEEVNIKYMHRPPTITPNYGIQRRSMLPKSKVSRVLLYDNATQDHMLDIKLAHINIEKERISRIINLHKRSFSHRQLKKQHLKQQLANSTGTKQSGKQRQRLVTDRMHRAPSISSGMNDMHLSANQNERNSPNNNHTQDNNDNVLNELKNQNPQEIHSGTPRETSEGVKLPAITKDSDKRHVIFKVKDASGKTKVYHTIDDDGILRDLLPLHTFYPKLTDDPRFRSLQDLLVPTYYGGDV